MKPFLLISLCWCLCFTGFSQEKSIQKPLTAKGNQFIGIGISPIASEMFNTETDLDFSYNANSYGLLPVFSYSKFVNENFMIGGMLFTGFSNTKYTYDYGSVPGVGFSSNKQQFFNLDLGIAPFARYYIPFNKRGSVALFMQGALPFVRSVTTTKSTYVINGVANNNKNTSSQNSFRGSIGFGLAVKTKFGSVDTHVSNMGWFISFNKLLASK